MLALQELGEALFELTDSDLGQFPISEALQTALRELRSMHSRGAQRRQRQLIGKLMRNEDASAIRAALGSSRSAEIRSKQHFALAETWRDRLVRDGVAAVEALTRETGRDDQELRKLVIDLETMADERREKATRRQIFRRVHALLGTAE